MTNNTIVNRSEAHSYLDTPLIKFTDSPADWWSIRDAVRGVQIFGSIGSGKTSGSGQKIAKNYLQHGFGGLVLCAKPGEAEEWVKYAKETGRAGDIVLFHEGSEWQFNALEYESTRTTKGGGLTFNLTELFMTAFKMGQRISGSSSEEKEKFWENSLKRCINRMIDLLKLSGERLSVYNMVEILNTAPVNGEALNKITNELSDEQILNWGKSNLCIKCLYYAGENAKSPQQERDFDLIFNYFLRDFALLDDKVKSTIKEMFLGYAEPFLSGILNDHFASTTNITPEDTFEGKIIIMDFSVKDYLVSGIYAQCLFKYLWQQAVERRNVTDHTIPVFLWVDESQYFVNEYDTIFQTTARSSRACTVFLTQNISNYYAQIGGKEASSKVDSLLGNLSTMIFHANSDAKTNEYASTLIGSALQNFGSVNETQDAHLNYSTSRSKTLTSQFGVQVQPRLLTTLKSGGEQNDYEVEAIMFVSGREWSDGRNFNEVMFDQKFLIK
ncbi:hypothetical protein BH10BAC2_BH10BAC2_27030 [soil metagenome]